MPVTDRLLDGRAEKLIAKIGAETDLEVLNAMQKSCQDRGEDLTTIELQAFARRRAELQRGK